MLSPPSAQPQASHPRGCTYAARPASPRPEPRRPEPRRRVPSRGPERAASL